MSKVDLCMIGSTLLLGLAGFRSHAVFGAGVAHVVFACLGTICLALFAIVYALEKKED